MWIGSEKRWIRIAATWSCKRAVRYAVWPGNVLASPSTSYLLTAGAASSSTGCLRMEGNAGPTTTTSWLVSPSFASLSGVSAAAPLDDAAAKIELSAASFFTARAIPLLSCDGGRITR